MPRSSRDFPFKIMDVATLLQLQIRRRQANSVYADCPFCGDKRGKMNLSLVYDVFRCNYCDEHGGMVALYAKAHGIGNSDAYREICEALRIDGSERAAQERTGGLAKIGNTSTEPPSVLQSELAGVADIHQSFSLLLSMLQLSKAHREGLYNRGLTDEQIDRLGYKSTPPPYLCKSYTERLIKQGCRVQGVPGFYLDDDGKWTVKFYKRTAGLLIPVKGIDGLLRGMQIRLDEPIKDENGDPEKTGTKYLWLSSSNKHMGVTSGSPVHFAGDPFAGTVYLTEGALKADVASCLMNRSFIAVAGANNLSQLGPIFALLAKSGTRLVVEAHDMDKYRNEMVDKGASKVYALAREHGIESKRLTWNPNYKGIDDWQLAVRRKKESAAKKYILPAPAEAATQRFRVYQLEFSGGSQTKPWAFQGIKALRKAGFDQPPAADYRLVHDSGLTVCKTAVQDEILNTVFKLLNDDLPDDYAGRSVSPSDIIELYGEEKRLYFYRDESGFTEVKFSPKLALPLRKCLHKIRRLFSTKARWQPNSQLRGKQATFLHIELPRRAIVLA